ncbi:MAG: Hsp33 family molecular chaperone HslO [Parahaliea sp.]
MNGNIPAKATSDATQRFVFENADLRGEIVQLDKAYRELLALHEYSPGVRALLGEFLAAAVLLSTTLKFDGRLVLQARSNGQIPLLMAECSSNLGIRGIARGAQNATAEQFEQLLRDGHLAITIEPDSGQRYQGVVPLDGDSLASCLDHYFEQSEQLSTRLWLGTDESRAAGMLLQQLPPNRVQNPLERTRQWEQACALGQTISTSELLELLPQDILQRLFAEETIQLFDSQPIRFECTCSRERTLAALTSIGAQEVASIIEEQGSVIMDCEFCNNRYQFQADELDHLLDTDNVTVH